MGKPTQVCPELPLLPSLLFCDFKWLIWTPPKYHFRERESFPKWYWGRKLEIRTKAWRRKNAVCNLILWQFLTGRLSRGVSVTLRTSRKSGLGGIRGDHCFRGNHFFSFLLRPEPCLWELLSHTLFCWPALQKCTAYTAWVGKLLELKVNVRAFMFHWLPAAEECFETEQLVNTLPSLGNFSVPVSVYYSLYRKIWGNFISWYPMAFSRAPCPFGYSVCFRSCCAAWLPSCSFPLLFWPFSVTCYRLCGLQNLIFIGRCTRRRRH